MSSYDLETVLLRFPFRIIPVIGEWLFELETPTPLSIAFSNCTLPTTFIPPFISTWGIYSINWALCNWLSSFGVVSPFIQRTGCESCGYNLPG